MSVKVKFKIGEKKGITANYTVKKDNPIKTVFKINAAASFYSLTGSPYDNANLKDALDAKADKSELDADMAAVDESISNVQTVVENNYNTLDTKIDNVNSDLSGDISTLENTVNSNNTAVNNRIDGIVDSFDGDISNLETAIQNEADARTNSDTLLQGDINTLRNDLTSEISNRVSADSNLQSQIDAITSASDVFDIVGTYAELEAYDISSVPVNDIIKVLVDSTHNNAATYYRCVENNNVKSWTYIGSEGAYYTKSEADNTFVTKSTTINNKPLSNNITLTASDVNALPADTIIGSGIITLQKNGVDIDSFNVNATANKSINISVPIDTGDLTNNAGYIKGIDNTDVINALGYTPYDNSNPAGYITSASLPTVNNSTITIQKNSSNIESFNLNQPTNKTINITVPIQTSDLTNNSGFITNTVNNLTNYYLKSETYTKTEVQDLISGITGITIEVVSVLPASGENGVIYLVPKEGASPDIYNEYIWVETDADFELIGNTEIDLTNYVQFTDLATVATSGNYEDLSNKPTIPTVGNGTITFTQGGVTKGTITTNQSGDTTIDFDAGGSGAVDSVNGQTGTVVLTASDVGALADTTTIPSKTSDLTNDSGFITGITSSDVTTALGYTPYNSTNPSGYITSSALNGYATETWVGNQGYLTGITSSDVVTALTYTPYNGATNPNGYITSADLPTNYVTTDTAQDISGRKTFLGEKAIYFKQQATSNKLGFTLYNPSNTELAALEYRPNTISSASLLALNCPQTTGGYVGFRYWGTPAVNIVAPKVATAGNYFMATHITNGTLTVTANNQGTVNISTLIPTIATSVSSSSTNAQTVGAKLFYDTVGNIETLLSNV